MRAYHSYAAYNPHLHYRWYMPTSVDWSTSGRFQKVDVQVALPGRVKQVYTHVQYICAQLALHGFSSILSGIHATSRNTLVAIR